MSAKFETTFKSKNEKHVFKLSLGLEHIPDSPKAIDPLHIVAYVLTQFTNVASQKLVFEKSQKFIFLNKDTNGYNLVDLARKGDTPPIELEGLPTKEQLAESFFITSEK